MDIIFKNKWFYIFLALLFAFSCSFTPMSKEEFMAMGLKDKEIKKLKKELKKEKEEPKPEPDPVESSVMKVISEGQSIPVNGSFNFDIITLANRENPVIFTIQNIGTKELEFTGDPVVEIDNNTDFAVDCTNITANGNKIAVNEQNTITIRYISKAMDGLVKQANITIKNNFGDDYKFTVKCTAKSESSVMNIVSEGQSIPTGGSFNFDTISASGRTNPIKFTIQNIGNKELVFTGNPVVVIDNNADFAVNYTNITAGGNKIATNGYNAITIQFISAAADGLVKQANVTIKNNLGDDYKFTVKCTAKSQGVVQYIVSGNYTWVSPCYGTISVFVHGAGGGGGGAGGNYHSNYTRDNYDGGIGGGGGAGWCSLSGNIIMMIGNTCNITVGKGGDGGTGGTYYMDSGYSGQAPSGSGGNNGGYSRFEYNGFNITANGGIGGGGGTGGSENYRDGSDGTGGNGDPIGSGINGGNGDYGDGGNGGELPYNFYNNSNPGDAGKDGYISIVWVGFVN